MSWFKRTNKNISTKTEEKKDIPAGLWYKTPSGKLRQARIIKNFKQDMDVNKKMFSKAIEYAA